MLMSEVLTDTAFAFLPALVAYSARRNLAGNPVVGGIRSDAGSATAA